MQNQNFFSGCQTLNDVKQEFRKLALANHPDKGGDAEIMKAINAAYEQAVRRVTLGGKSQKTGFTFTESEVNEQIRLSEEYQKIINKVAGLDGIAIELVGDWIWITGATYPHRETLKGAGFFWACKKAAWYFRSEEFKCKTYGKRQSLDEIRAKYGTVKLESKTRAQLN